MTQFETTAASVLARLRSLRDDDAPTHGGHVLSYVYDSGLAEIDELAAAAARLMQPVNGLDPTTFGSVAVLEGEVIDFARRLLGGDEGTVGSVTSGGTESCLLAVKTARDMWRANGGVGTPRIVAPTTVHAAFHKAAHYFGLHLDLVPVSARTGSVEVAQVVERLGPDAALVVISAPSYPFAALDPIGDVAAICAERGIGCHVDACIGGFALPFDDTLPAWDLRVPGVTSLSADLHKYGYAPKGASVLLHRSASTHHAQFFATSRWPGYPVVNATMLGSKSAAALAAAWAIIQVLGAAGFAELAARSRRATDALLETIDGIDGLTVVGAPVGPLFAVAADPSVPSGRRVDPHRFADAARRLGWLLQLQPGFAQDGGERLPATTHLTVTPVTESVLPELTAALVQAADSVRGLPAVDATDAMDALGGDVAAALDGPLPDQLAPLLALVEALPPEQVEGLLVRLIASVTTPR
ncbi:aminotransferase class V-fold PLP-dependent enzyme [Herbiconiux sp. L3-i23]|uniref:pyridoxal phosphate-dependent decarboxylase family protein n=1 Tax=Herbiconiux sp. L3-i23 TaxID=2905871 RepID=UPI00205FADCA|nr:aminotransferase class V-fold PLP-dependent enzyme [Herbiconiux sp. L3-i23]BDI23465.1 aspartate aminotransferase family protein [Herbiconiux sp. L3-i23]